ncbi:helix-turn-helix transcriptional regulator [Amylibacter marinus]|uniref:helix-turn-helix transcriptional regulator n=1 Tax=Amylibacter marinus TaxID=1475483 RepID=UPI0024E13DCB|nr:LuxR family transcriptional regulator [Amylibacter marinus]
MSKNIGLDNEFAKLGAIAPLGYGVGLHIRFASPLISLYTWSKEWQDHYTGNVYGLRDPMIAWAFAKKGACRWSECPLPDPFGIISQAGEFGLTFGATISCGPLSSRTIVGISRDDREFTDDELNAALDVVEFLHEKAEPPESLTKAQKEALQLVAAGYRYAEAAQKLGISESALKLRLSSARNRLLARTTGEAIQRAKDYKLM